MSLRDQQQLEFGQLMMVYQHHERIDGYGLPGPTGRERNPRMVANLRGGRRVRGAHQRTSLQPCSFGGGSVGGDRKGENKGLDPEFFQCWKMTIKTI